MTCKNLQQIFLSWFTVSIRDTRYRLADYCVIWAPVYLKPFTNSSRWSSEHQLRICETSGEKLKPFQKSGVKFQPWWSLCQNSHRQLWSKKFPTPFPSSAMYVLIVSPSTKHLASLSTTAHTKTHMQMNIFWKLMHEKY